MKSTEHLLSPRRARHCRHYGYNIAGSSVLDGGPTCAAGLDNTRPGDTAACMPRPSVLCAHRVEFTEAENRERDRSFAAAAERMLAVLGAVPNGRPGDSGEFACPACQDGTVRYSYAMRNGHVTARCSTPGCCAVME